MLILPMEPLMLFRHDNTGYNGGLQLSIKNGFELMCI